ncbi:ATP-binding cassette domain-containing protein [Streptomyces platensis]|uniref:ATP-binding cassette domain-containing protein n=1 Tax=Streptomyces platensis TaxID=58346 RepID=UPI003C2B4628
MRDRAHTAVPTVAPAAAAQLSVKDVTKSYGARTVLDQASFTVRPGEKAAVIGENGSGKSTLLRLLAAAEMPDTGEITVGFPGGTGHLAQTIELGADRTVQDVVDLALAELRGMERQLRRAEESLGEAAEEELAAYGELLIAYEERGGYEAEARVDAAMHGLGLARVTRDRLLGSLSGGEQARLALACVLAAAPQLLLLDEPTNHLDATAVRWLEEHLRAHRGTVVAVTHDRGFLERIATTILEVDRDARTVFRYGDGWAGYRAAKAAARRGAEQRYADWVEEVARMEQLLEDAGRRLATTGRDPKQGFGKHRRSSQAKLGGQVRSVRERLAQLRRNPVAEPPAPLRFTTALPTADGPAQGPLVELDDVRVGERLCLDGLLAIAPGQRLLVTGENGAGKTTLLRVLAGDLEPDARPDRHRPGRSVGSPRRTAGYSSSTSAELWVSCPGRVCPVACLADLRFAITVASSTSETTRATAAEDGGFLLLNGQSCADRAHVADAAHVRGEGHLEDPLGLRQRLRRGGRRDGWAAVHRVRPAELVRDTPVGATLHPLPSVYARAAANERADCPPVGLRQYRHTRGIRQ